MNKDVPTLAYIEQQIFTPVAPSVSGFEVNLDAVCSEPANDNEAEHGVMPRSLIRW